MAMTPKERKRAKRERKRLSEEERVERLLSRKIVTELYRSTDLALIRIMARAKITEEQDMITRLIHGADRSSDEQLSEKIRLS